MNVHKPIRGLGIFSFPPYVLVLNVVIRYVHLVGTWQSPTINAWIMSVRECRLSLTIHLQYWLPESCYHWLLWVFHVNPCYYVEEIPNFNLVFEILWGRLNMWIRFNSNKKIAHRHHSKVCCRLILTCDYICLCTIWWHFRKIDGV